MGRIGWGGGLAVLLIVALAACGTGAGEGPEERITVYSGREEPLVAPVFERFTQATGMRVDVRYADTAQLAAQILEEGANSPADVFFAQDGGALGALQARDMLEPLDQRFLDAVPAWARSDAGAWVGVTGRARTIVYNTERVDPAELPDSIMELTDQRWRGRIGWVPQNASFQAFVTALRMLHGDEATRAWLRGVKANDPTDYPKNTPAVEAVAAGEVDIGLVNHYYLAKMKQENPGLTAENHFIGDGDPGALVNVAGVGILRTSDAKDAATRFVEYLLGTEAQTYFRDTTFEYPLAAGLEADPRLPSLDELDPPALDLSRLADLETTLTMLREEGLL